MTPFNTEKIEKEVNQEIWDTISTKVEEGSRISDAEGLWLYENATTENLGALANKIRQRLHGNKVYWVRNFHIEPTNICVFDCTFCSYKRKEGEPGAWEHNENTIRQEARKQQNKGIQEVHITGGVHPNHTIDTYCKILDIINEELPEVAIKAFSAVELDHLFRRAHVTPFDGIRLLKAHGLALLPGGGAEIFDEAIRAKICPDKSSTKNWLAIHQAAHLNGLSSNATMLYGHIESYRHRIHHMSLLRELQDETKGFQAFIPLKYKKENNVLGIINEVSLEEDLRNYAVARIYMDNISHLKAYWPALGRESAIKAVFYGVDDMDGTIDNTTAIYTMAGSEETKPSITSSEMYNMISKINLIPTERDSMYNMI